jgi:TPR repeat protein
MQFGRAQWHSGQPTRGLKSLEQAANAGSGAAAYEAFERYNVISGPFRNKMSADRVIRLGAKLGNPQSAYRLGLWLELGEPHGIVNLPGAAEWYRKAADLNIAEAQYRLGLMLRDGKGIDPNREEALHFLNLAAEAGHERASAEIAVMQQYNPNLTPDDSSYVEQLEYFAELGSSNAQYNLGVLYENGFGVPQDYHRAKQLYLQAYMDWHGKAGYAMGLLVLKEGKGSRPSLDTAAGWFESAASADPSIRSEATSAASAARARLRQNRRSEDENMHLTVLAGIVVFGLIMNLGGPSGDGAGGFEGVGRPPGICDDPVGRDLAREWCY